MKTSSKSASKFSPITLTITLESPDEYSIFLNLVQHNVSVPQFLYSNEHDERELLSDMLSLLSNELRGYQKHI